MRKLNVKERDLLDRVTEKSELQPFFFRRLKGLHWFDPLNERGFFNPENNPEPVSAQEEGYIKIPSWPVTNYFVAVSEELSDPINVDYAVKYMGLLRNITAHAKRTNFSNHRTWWQLSKTLKNIPVHLIQLEDVGLLDYWLDDPYERGLVAEEIGEKWLPELLKNSDEHSMRLAIRILEILFKVEFVERKPGSYKTEEAILRYSTWHANKIINKVGTLSGLKLGLEAVELFQKILISMIDRLGNDRWSSIWRPAIEDHEQNKALDDAKHLLVTAYRDCLLGCIELDAEATSTYLETLLEGQYQTLKRIAIYIINVKFEILKTTVDFIIKSDFFENNFRHELWHLFKTRFRDFSPELRDRTLNIINGLEALDDKGNARREATLYKRSIWLSAIKDSDDQAARLYNEYIKIIGREPEHPDFSSYMTGGWVDNKSPVPIERLLGLSIEDLIDTINNYEDPTPNRYGEPRKEGLVKSFKEVVKSRAEEFYPELMKFINCDLAFIYQLIEAYRELWNEKREGAWEGIWPCLFDFCEVLVSNEVFWSEDNAKERRIFVANRHWVVGAIGRLIEDGTKSDQHAFDAELLPKAKRILLELLARQEGQVFDMESDAVFVAINSPRGRCIEALVNLTLRACRIADHENGDHSQIWEQYNHIYDEELRRSKKGEYEFATLVAMFLPNFLYMSPEWVRANLGNIFDNQNYQKWLCSMQGYAYVNRYLKEVYEYLRINEQILRILDDENLKDRVQEKMIQNIVISYFNDDEDIDQPESTISLLINRKNYNELHHLVWFVWTLRENIDVNLKEKIFRLWPKLLEIVDLGYREGRKLASHLCSWATFVEDIEEPVEGWLMQIAPYAEQDHNSYDLLVNLARISETQPLKAQKIWIEMLRSYSYDYPEEAIRQILNNLILLGREGERKAKEVVDAYLKHGTDRPRNWLKEVKGSV